MSVAPKGREVEYLKYDISEFGLVLVALYQHPEGPINFRRNPLPLLYSQNLFV